ncbi:MAG: hypothetical protein ACYC3X_05780 [Pirellulaceae bacterium]
MPSSYDAIDLLRPGGKLLIIGIPEVARVSFDPDKVRRKEITLVNIRRQRGCVQTALDLIGTCRPDVEALITHQFPFSDAKAAFDLVADYRDGVVKAIIGLD